MEGIELKARRLRLTHENGRALTQPQFAKLLNMNPNSIAIMERRGFVTVAQKRYGHLLDLALNWIEYRSGLQPWDPMGKRERRPHIKRAKSVVRSDDLDPQLFDLLVGHNTKKAIEVLELVLKEKKISRNAHLGGGKDLRAPLAFRLAKAGLLKMQTIDADRNPADRRKAFRNSTLDRIYAPNPQRDKSVEKMLRDLGRLD